MVTRARRVLACIRRFAFFAALSSPVAQLPAQGLPEVPKELSQASHELLTQVRASLVKRGNEYDAKGPGFLARCGPGKIKAGDGATMTSCLAEQDALAREIKSLEIDEKNYKTRVVPWTDASVVDARGPMNGAFLSNQVPELRNSPEVGQINKGYDAILIGRWDITLAWWKQAYFKDPKNESLRRSVELAQWMVDRAAPHKAGLPSALSIAIHTGSTGDWPKAILQFEAAKKDNPAIAPLANHMIKALKEKQATAEYWNREIRRTSQQLVDDLRMDAALSQMMGMDERARELYRLSDWYAMSLPCTRTKCAGN